MILRTEGLTKTFEVGFRRRRVQAVQDLTLSVSGGRDLRVRRAERRRQDDHHQDADGAHLPDERLGAHVRRPDPEPRGEGADRLPARAPRLLRLPHRASRRCACSPSSPASRAPSGVRAATSCSSWSGSRGRRRPPDQEVLEGHAAAARDRPGAGGGPGVRRARRADERARSGRPQGDARPHPRAEAPGQDGVLLDAHPPRRRDALRPRRGHHRGEAPGRRHARWTCSRPA